ncbi:HD domain-containing protein [uncultured Aquimarina sp.]|uniref:HD domain-containing protein n=1 Tax=uncultured Aquimarina sp. TaxID=575652 RepID=UPI00263466AD|nr:HD domain-containing protein [uncultured Aquimarina sp.]
MKKRNKLKILNDPIYGFITIPNELIFDLIEHRYFQRLRRISQMGLSYLVYPGAHHTRFHHALGCMHLMQNAVRVLRFKGVSISSEEEDALCIAILLHDIGHGPFSHAMEHSIVNEVTHESISLMFMEKINKEFNGSLTLAIQIFKGEYHRNFLYQLISGQLDMDRLDYLKRDSFYTGVAEGNINSERLITMLNVVDDELVVEEKGIYSVEKFLLARRLMYWQVYLHKTSLVAESLLIRVLKRAKELVDRGVHLNASKALKFFLENKITADNFTIEVLETFSKLDDYDIISAMKEWTTSEDFVLRNLSNMIIDRDLLKIKIKKKSFGEEKIRKRVDEFKTKYEISEEEARYFVFTGTISNQAYHQNKQNINILYKSSKIVDIVSATDQFNLKALSKPVTKYFICYPKHID